MSLNKIQLPDFQIPSFFKDTLVITDDLKAMKRPSPTTEKVVPEPQNATAASPRQFFLGENKRNITIIVNDDEAVFLRDSWLQFLINILAACKLNIGDVAIINQSQIKTAFAELQSITAPKYLITFDVACKDIGLPFSIPHYQVQPHGNCSLLLCPPLSLMLGDTAAVKIEKTKLWVSLKRIFNI